MSKSSNKEKGLKISKYWLELNNWGLPFPGHVGLALWDALTAQRKSEYESIKKSAKELGQLIIIHYLGTNYRKLRRSFIGESRLYDKEQDYRTYSWKELVEELKYLFKKQGYGEEMINKYLEKAEKHLQKKGYLDEENKVYFFLLRLSEYKEYNRPISSEEISFASNIIRRGKYLITLKQNEYMEIRSKGFSALNGKKRTRLLTRTIEYREFREFVSRHGGLYPEEVLNNLVAGYNKGKHILLVGPPGAGKSFLAELLANYLGYELFRATASSSWTRYDFIGGPIISRNGFRWKSGILLKALSRHIRYISGEGDKEGVILLIDELNRCEADKVLAEFFTIYPGIDPEQWRIPEALIDEISGFGDEIDEETEIVLDYIKSNKVLPWGFRVVATINSWDITHLYTLGYALLRRFHIIEVQPRKIGDNDDMFKKTLFNRVSKIIKKTSNVDNQQLNEIIEKMTDISKVFIDNGFPLGIAYIVEATVDAYNIVKTKILNKTVEEAIDIALSSVLSSILSPEISKIMLPRKYIESLTRISKENRLSKYEKVVILVNRIVSTT